MIKAKAHLLGLGIAILFGCTTMAPAATVELFVQPTQAFDQDFNPVPIPDLSEELSSPVYLELSVSFLPHLDVSMRDFRHLYLGYELDSVAEFAPFSASLLRPQVPLPGGTFVPVFPDPFAWAPIYDAYPIKISKLSGLADSDPRTTFDGYPVELGTLSIRWDGQNPASLIFLGFAGFNSKEPNTFQSVFVSHTFRLGGDPIPEPTTLWPMLVALASLIVFNRGCQATAANISP